MKNEFIIVLVIVLAVCITSVAVMRLKIEYKKLQVIELMQKQCKLEIKLINKGE